MGSCSPIVVPWIQTPCSSPFAHCRALQTARNQCQMRAATTLSASNGFGLEFVMCSLGLWATMADAGIG
eukprot:2964408-Amphidinium_carterae.2